MGTFLRPPAVAGRFYPDNPTRLTTDVRAYTDVGGAKLEALGCVVPHAGYMFSGHVAGAVYARLQLPRRYIILCPNHTGMGKPLAIMSRGAWETPLGNVEIDRELADKLKQSFPQLMEDVVAHSAEHALEVQLPFLQVLAGDFIFVPITVGTGQFGVLEALGEAMARVLREEDVCPLIISSSDMNHYEPDDITRVKDRKAIDKIIALDPRGLFDVVREAEISMCGYAPTVAMLTAVKRMGAKEAQLIKYATSGDISGDRDLVVGYAGIAIK
jgi:AmmeMemoRadiSam system protein B